LLQIVTDVLIVATFLGALVFVAGYARSRFQRSAWGRWLMADTVVIMLVSGLATINVFWGMAWPGRDIVRLLCWAAVTAVVWWRNRLRWAGRDKRSGVEETGPHGD
jgi:hypothetical protein